ncbi:hypothetical protein HOD83_02875 [Candidatus Woesearchaeota archaeon]|jgi:NhaP-type Na+/H+ or K+/H+ antiporter|nr:hypothetical protein [Candidatus Woesearchaeota archaeon]MBT4114611.1 hypothetical protein [Candidatus Woesearchaeota archaeon]MBT4248505.1 hypothetical protein [Candidatus Woesearchaeota archaeon]
MDPNLIVTLIGAVILLGVFLANISKKTGWPLSLILLIVGLVIGPITGWLDAAAFSSAIQSFAIIALVIILFDVGYDLKISKIKKELFESTRLAFVGVFSTMVVVFLISKYLLGLDTYLALLFGALLASTDLTVIAPLVQNLKLKQRTKEAMSMEATLNSVFAAVIAIVVGVMIQYKSNFAEAISRGLIYHIVTGVAIGLILGWILLKSVRKLKFDQMPALITVGAVLVVYAATEMIGASGIIAALIVGLLYGNTKPAPPKFVMLFGENLQMILITFVYIMLGALITFDAFVDYSLIAFILVASVILTRYFAMKLVTQNDSLLAQRVIGIAGPRGIISAILVLSYAHLFPDPNLIISMGFAVILGTSLAVFLLPVIEEKTNPRIKKAGLRL